MFALIVSYHARSEQYIFDNIEDANAQMQAIESKIGKKWYGKNGDEENPTYRFKFKLGEATLCLEKIESVAVLSDAEAQALADLEVDRKVDRHIRMRVREKTAMNNAGLAEAGE